MDLIAYWKFSVYQRDMPRPTGFHFNSNKARLHDALGIGERLWLVSGVKRREQLDFVLLARLVVAKQTINSGGYEHGRFRIIADPEESAYFRPDGPDMTDPVLRRLSFVGGKRIGTNMPRKDIPMALLSMRGLTLSDQRLLDAWAEELEPIETAFHPPA